MVLSKAIEGFVLSKLADGLSPNTMRIYRAALAKLVMFTGDQEVADITTDDLRRWMVWLRNDYKPPEHSVRRPEHLSTATVQQAWRALKSFYAWVSVEFGLPRVDTLKQPEGESPVIVPFTETEVRAILKAAEYTVTKETPARRGYTQKRPSAARNVALVLVLVDTGLRIGEVSRLTIGDLDAEAGAMNVAPFGSGRKSRARTIQLGKSARRALWRYLAGRDAERGTDRSAPLFTTEDGKPFTSEVLGRLVRNIGNRAGVPHAHAHRYRHTHAIEFLRNGGDVFTLQKLLGHRSLEMTKRYLDIAQTDLEAAHRRASPADHWRL
jgi:integrase/recombinase XerD